MPFAPLSPHHDQAAWPAFNDLANLHFWRWLVNGSRAYEARISPADVLRLPTVLDTADLMNVLRIGENRVRELVATGQLGRLRYSREIKVYRGEVLRFLRDQTGGAA